MEKPHVSTRTYVNLLSRSVATSKLSTGAGLDVALDSSHVAVGDKVNVGNHISRLLRTPETVHHPNVKIYVSPDHSWFEHYRGKVYYRVSALFSLATVVMQQLNNACKLA